VGFERNVDLLVTNILSDGAIPVLFPFVQASDEIFESLTGEAAQEAAFTVNSRRGCQIALEKNTAVLHKLAKQHNVPIIEFDASAIPLEHWLDHCHLSREGEQAKAQFVAGQLQRIIQTRL
jgi:hypothetical protein